MRLAWMTVVAVIALVQKMLPAKALLDIPPGHAITGLGIWILVASTSVAGLMTAM